MANELPDASKWVYSKLSGLAGGRVYEDVAPPNTVSPWIVFQVQSGGNDRDTVSGHRHALDPLYLVRVIGQTGSWSALQTIANSIDAALQGASGTAGTARVVACRRRGAFRQIDPQDAQYRHLGGFYRLLLET